MKCPRCSSKEIDFVTVDPSSGDNLYKCQVCGRVSGPEAYGDYLDEYLDWAKEEEAMVE